MKTGFLFSVIKTPEGVIKTLLPLLSALLFTTAIVAQAPAGAVYYHPFTGANGGAVTSTGTTGPYTVQPAAAGGSLAAGLSNSSWSNSGGGWAFQSGQPLLQMPNTAEPASITLTFNVANGYLIDLDAVQFKARRQSVTSASNWAMTINGTPVGSGTITSVGAVSMQSVGPVAMPTGFPNNLSGTISVVITLTGGSGVSNNFLQIDDFALTGTVYGAGPDQVTCANSNVFLQALPGNGVTWSSSDPTGSFFPDNTSSQVNYSISGSSVVLTMTTPDLNGNPLSDAVNITVGTLPDLVLGVTAASPNVCPGQNITLNVVALSGFSNISNLSFGLQFDPTKLTYVSNQPNPTISGGLVEVGIENVASGRIDYILLDDLSETLPNGSVILSVTFSVPSNTGIGDLDIVNLFTGLPISANTLSGCALNVVPDNSFNLPLTPSVSIDAGGPYTTCVGGFKTLAGTGSGFTNYSWSASPTGGTFINQNSLNAIFSSASAGTYNLTLTGTGSACGTLTDQATIVFSSTPITMGLQLDGPANAGCGNSTAYQVKATGFTSLVDLEYSVNWDATKFTYISHTVGTIGGNPQVNLIGNNKINFVWGSGSGITLPAGTTLLTVNLAPIGGIGNSGTISFGGVNASVPTANSSEQCEVTVNSTNRTITFQNVTVTCPANMTVCSSSSSFALSGALPEGGTYTASPVAAAISGGNFNPATAGVGTHTITYTFSAGGCSGSCTFTITVINAPVVSGVPATLCPGSTANATSNTSGGTWSSSNTSVATVSAGGLVTAVASGSAIITYDVNGCIGSTPLTVSSTETANAGADEATCSGALISLSGTTSTGTGTWTSSGGGTFPVGYTSGLNTVFTIDNTFSGQITFTLTSGGPCPVTDTKVVTVGSIPAVVLTANAPNTASCGGGALFTVTADNFTQLSSLEFSLAYDPSKFQFSATQPTQAPIAGSAPTITNVASGQITFTWATGSLSGATLVDGSVIASISFTALTNTGTGAIAFAGSPVPSAASNIQLCDVPVSTTNSSPVVFQPLTISCPGNQQVCVNGFPIFLGPVSPASGTFSYNGPVGGLNASSGEFFPAIAGVGVWTVTYTASFGSCTSTCSFTVTVNALPNAAIAVAENSGATPNDGILCAGDNATLTASGGTDYVWSNGATTAQITVSAAGTYSVTVTDANGCTNTASRVITVNSPVTPTFGNIGPFCQNSLPTALPTTSSNGINGTWNPATISTGTVGTANYTFTPSAGQCATSVVVPITVTAPTQPTFNAIAPVCVGATAPALPTTSTNSITGTWDGAVSTANAGTFTFNFTPTAGQCASGTSITVTVNALPTAAIAVTENSGATPNDGILCAGDNATLTASGGTGYVWSTGATTAQITVNAAGTYSVTVTDANGCTNTASRTITVNPLVAPTFGNIGPFCQNSTPTALPTSSSNGITGTWNPVTINTSTPGTSTYTFTPSAGECATSTQVQITITPLTTPTFATIPQLCVNSTPPALPAASGNITGTWSPATISTAAAGTFTFTFTPDPNQCAASTTITVTVGDPVLPTFNQVGPLCQGAMVSPLPTTSNNGITGTWNAPISTSAPGQTTYTFTPSAGQCATTATLTVTVNAPTVPTFDPIASVCVNAPAPELPASSTNGISGTWNPATVSTGTAGTQVYTFTPAAGQCATTATLSVTVNAQTVPTFNTIAPVCVNAPAPVLPASSTNSISGTWSPATVSTGTAGTQVYTFTPASGQCATTATLSVTVNAQTVPAFDPIASVCVGAPAPMLPASSTNSISGTWNPATVSTGTVGTQVYTFTPAAGQCATTATLSVTVNAQTVPTFSAIAPVCQGTAPIVLVTTSNNGIAGTWNPATLSTTTPGTVSSVFTPASGTCATTANISVTVNARVTPTFDPIASVCVGATPPMLPAVSNNGINGTWTPSTVNTETAGTTTYNFTPAEGECANPGSLTVTVTPLTVPTFAPIGPLCQGTSAPALPGTSTNGVTGTWSPATINTSTIGSSVYTFTPNVACAQPTTLTIVVNALQITCPPVNQNLPLNANCAAVLPDYRTLIGLIGNCTPPTLTQTPAPGTPVSGTGTVAVVITATVDGQVVSTCNINVNKVDNTLPTVVCTNTTVSFDGQATITLDPNSFVSSATDNCGPVTISISPTSVSCQQVGQTIPVVVTATDVNGNVRTCNATVTVGGLPCNWSGAMNGLGCSGTSAFNPANNTWSLASNNCFYGPSFTADQFTFAKRSLCGNGVITARVTAIGGNISGWAGIVMRENSTPGAKKAQLTSNLGTLSRREFRTTTGGSAFPQQFISVDRYWLRLVRSGNQFLGYVSPNGSTWYPVMAQTISMNQCIEIGLILYGAQPVGTTTATFSNVSVSGNTTVLMAPETGISVDEAPNGIEVFPNPTDGLLNVDISSYYGKAVRIELYNMQGKLMEFSELDEVQAPLQEMDLSRFPGGAYFIRVKSEGMPDATQRVILGNSWRP